MRWRLSGIPDSRHCLCPAADNLRWAMAGADDAGWADADTKGAQRPQKGHKKRRTSRFALFAIVKKVMFI
jgi:hypothetical protein